MDIAVAQARASFDAFLTKAKYPGESDSDFSVKVAIEDGQHTQHICLNDLKVDQEPFEGTIGNEPYFITKVKFGDRYRFTREDISDWTYVSDGVVQGSYTVRFSMKAMSKAESDALAKQFGWQAHILQHYTFTG